MLFLFVEKDVVLPCNNIYLTLCAEYPYSSVIIPNYFVILIFIFVVTQVPLPKRIVMITVIITWRIIATFTMLDWGSTALAGN